MDERPAPGGHFWKGLAVGVAISIAAVVVLTGLIAGSLAIAGTVWAGVAAVLLIVAVFSLDRIFGPGGF